MTSGDWPREDHSDCELKGEECVGVGLGEMTEGTTLRRAREPWRTRTPNRCWDRLTRQPRKMGARVDSERNGRSRFKTAQLDTEVTVPGKDELEWST